MIHLSEGDLKIFKFPGGEVQVKLLSPVAEYTTITAHLTSSDDIMSLILTVDALRRGGCKEIGLLCPYLPYARQDRVCAPGEALSLRVLCNLLNSLKFALVIVWDVHSEVALALLDNVTNLPQEDLVVQTIASFPELRHTFLVSPDAGSMKKIYRVAKTVGLPFMRADKVRDVMTGAITDTVVYTEPLEGLVDPDFLIVDDICDGGRTFIELAKKLRPLTQGKIYLYVTHGIFSQGFEVFRGLIDGIYTANLFPPDTLPPDFVHVTGQ